MFESKFNSLLRAALRRENAHVDQIETGMVGKGVPDLHVFSGKKGTYWIELKVCHNKTKLTVDLSAPQVVWHQGYADLGGRSWIAVHMEITGKTVLLRGRDALEASLGTATVVATFSSVDALAKYLEN